MLVRYFAGAAAAAGTDEESLDLDATTTVAELRASLGRQRPGLVPVLAVASLLVDGVVATDDDAPLAAATQVDVLPPFAGG